MILVIGGRSKIGSALIDQLVAKGEAVRALARPHEGAGPPRDGVETVMGDLSDPDSLRSAIAGTDRMLLLCGPTADEVQLNRHAIDVAREAGVALLVSMKKGPLSSSDRELGSSSSRDSVWSDAHVSMASSSGGSGEIGCSLGRKSEKGGQAARRKAAPRGANFSLRESMCQIAWASLRAMSTWATLAPRCFPSRRLIRW